MGVEPTLQVEPSKISFGIVGIENPEFREITVTNTCGVDLRIGSIMEDTDSFKIEIPEE
jgi:hypothetical protein